MPTYNLTDGRTKRAYAARITGPHPKFKLTREFLDATKRDGRHKTFRFTDEGIYELVEYSAKDNQHKYYKQLADSTLHDLTEAEVLAHFNAPTQSEKPSAETNAPIVEECWECGAQYKTYGNVESGNMGCRRCD